MSFIKPSASQRRAVVWARARAHAHARPPWLQFSSSLWSMQSKTSSQRQRRGMQCARFRQRNSSSRHSFTHPICGDRKQQVSEPFAGYNAAPPEHSLMFEWISGDCGLGKKSALMNGAGGGGREASGGSTDLIGAVEAVVMSVTSQAG